MKASIIITGAALSAISLAFPCCAAADSAAESYPGKAYGDKPREIPGIIQAALYDVAPGNVNGITYNRHGEPRPGSARTTGDCIGLGVIGSDHVSTTGEKQKEGEPYVGWTDTGDWWKYTVKVTRAGTYMFGGHFAAGGKGSKISATFTPLSPGGTAAATGPLEIPTTAGYQPGVEVYHVWEKLPKLAEVSLSPGIYILTVKAENAAGLNIDYYSFSAK